LCAPHCNAVLALKPKLPTAIIRNAWSRRSLDRLLKLFTRYIGRKTVGLEKNLMIPPEHRTQIEPILEQLRQLKI
jgi:hypothetical protein